MADRGPAPKGFQWCKTEDCRVQIREGGYRWCCRCRGAWGAARRDEGTYMEPIEQGDYTPDTEEEN